MISSPLIKSEELVESVVNNVLDLNVSRDYKFITENDEYFILVDEFRKH
jgi:hypothetical protein